MTDSPTDPSATQSNARPTTQSVATASAPSVVRIGRGPGRGAGVVTAPGVVATNAHNLRGSTTTVTFHDGRQVTGTVAGVDADGDLAAITLDTGGATPLEWVTEAPSLGQAVLAMAVMQGGGVRITTGTVSSTQRQFRGPGGRLIVDAIEHTAPLAPGSSGGPVLDEAGRLVAISTHRLGDGFYLAVPASAELRSRIDRLSRGDAPSRLRLGVALVPGHVARRIRASAGLPERDGLLVRGVEDGSPAAGAGLRQGDLIVAAGGQPLTSLDGLASALDSVGGGQSGVGSGGDMQLTLSIVRGSDELELTATFTEDQPPDA